MGRFREFDQTKVKEGFKGLGEILDFGFVYQMVIGFRLDLIAFVSVGIKFYLKTSPRKGKLGDSP